MYNECAFNDTFDNISFTVSGNNNRNKICDKNVLEIRSQFEDVLIKNNTLLQLQNITLDDSIFLSESFDELENLNSALILSNDDNIVEKLETQLKIKHECGKPRNGHNMTIQQMKKTSRSQKTLVQKSTCDILREDGVLQTGDMIINLSNECDTSSITEHDIDYEQYKCMSKWDLPQAILEKYKEHKVETMFEWQVRCLRNKRVLEKRKNLVYSAPTSAGKTLVAELLAIKTVLEIKKKVVFVLPFVSVVREKMFYFQDILGSSGIRVEGFMGSYNPPGGFSKIHIAICTIEKANSIINRLLEENNLSQLGAVVIDEMHLLGDSARGYQLELLLTKLKYMQLKDSNINIQIIGMSATLPNLSLLAKWLDADLFSTEFRPIPLVEQCYVGGEIYDANLNLQRKLLPFKEIGNDCDNILQLCLETIFQSCSVLIFCPTKNWCESLCQQIAQAFWNMCKKETELRSRLQMQFDMSAITEVLQQLKGCPVGLDKILETCITFGVSFHHAGLTMDERDIIEGAFKRGVLRVLVATSTLSSGVNLPARRVIIRTPMFHGKTIDTLTYRQMIGRAGRMGKDSAGESILICQKADRAAARILLSSPLAPIESCLEGAGRLNRAILEVIASEVASTPEDVHLFAKSTLLAAESTTVDNPIDDTVKFLLENEFIRLQTLDDLTLKYFPTPLGKACLSSSMAPEEGLMLFAELQKARQCFVLDTELHIIYLVTPYSACNQWSNIDWMMYLEMWEKLSTSMKRVGELVGISEFFLMSQARGKIQTNTSKSRHILHTHKRFYTALALQDLVNEVPLNVVAKKYNCNRGLLQSLQQSASSFAGMVTTFSRQLGWSTIEVLLAQFQDRLQFGVGRELLDLMKLSMLDGPRARALYNSGIETLVQLASCDSYVLENVLYKSTPFESAKLRDGETVHDAAKRNKLRSIWIAGKQGLTAREAADMLIDYARRYLQYEMGLTEVKWNTDVQRPDALTQNNSVQENINQNTLIKCGNEVIDADDNRLKTKMNSFNTSLKFNKAEHSTPNTKTHTEISNRSADNMKTTINNKPLVCDSSNSRSHSLFSDTSLSLSKLDLDQNIIENCYDDDCDKPHDSGFEINSIQQSSSISSENSMEIGNGTEQLDGFKNSFGIASRSNLPLMDSFTDLANSAFNSPMVIPTLENKSDDCILSSQAEVDYRSMMACSRKKRQRQSLDSDKDLILKTPRKKSKLSILELNKSNCNFISVINNHGLPVQHPCKTIENVHSDEENCVDFSSLEIVNVCANEKLFDTFTHEIKKKNSFAVSVACCSNQENKIMIGQNVLNTYAANTENKENEFSFKSRLVKGISFSWGGNVAYYIELNESSNIVHSNKIVHFIQRLFSNGHLSIRMFDAKEQIKLLKKACDVEFNAVIDDPKIGDWLLQLDGKEKNLQSITLTYVPEAVGLAQMVGGCKGIGSVGSDLHSAVDPKVRSCIEAVVTHELVNCIKKILVEQDQRFADIYDLETRAMLSIAEMELTGFPVRVNELTALAEHLKELCRQIEAKAYQIAKRRFSFTSSKEICQVLGLYRGKKISANKQVLEQNEHPISKLVLHWRKLNSSLTKMVYPLLRLVDNDRIHMNCITFNSTGRISMHEPNLQNVPRDFDVPDLLQKTNNVPVRCRSTFGVPEGHCLISADYCQLELRLLSHLSQDTVLCSVMQSDQDVFKLIAANWKNIDMNNIDDKLRQSAKQICYGIIYGIGKKALAEQMGIAEDEADNFVESFHQKYISIRNYISDTIEGCRKNGYVQTITGRRRYLPNINNSDLTLKSQAERQAVNTTIQGSAADIAKNAMVIIDRCVKDKFKHRKSKPMLVLQLHDELIYESPNKHKDTLCSILKSCMENSVDLSVPFPIKLKSGPTWGEMHEIIL